MIINERIREARNKLNMSQVKFAASISVSNGYLAGIELGNRRVNDRLIKLMASEHGINPHWLKTGEGEMFLDESAEDRTNRVVSIFRALSPDFQNYVLQQLDKLLELHDKTTL